VNASSLEWLETADLVQMASDQQMERYEGDPWEEVIGPWVEERPIVSISEVLQKCVQKPQALWTQTDKNPRRPVSEGVGLGAIPGAARVAAAMALSERRVTIVPDLFPVRSRSVPRRTRVLDNQIETRGKGTLFIEREEKCVGGG
jgi:hypothetical protein